MPRPVVDETVSQNCQLFTLEQVDQFQRDGYIIVPNMAGPDLCNRMLAATTDGLQRLVRPLEFEADLQYPGAPSSRQAKGGRTVRRLKQAHSRDIVFTEWVSRPGLVRRLRQLLGPEVVMPLAHHNCIMTKHPDYSSETGWHQDIRYWSFARPELISVWLALTDEHPQNGCLRLIPGSHRVAMERNRLDELLFLRADLAENRELIETAVCAELAPGDVLFFHCRTLHAADRNHTDTPKYSAVFTYRSGDNRPIPGTRSASLPELVFP